MKILKITLLLMLVSCLTFSCSSSDSNNDDDGNQDLANQQNQLEDATIALANLNSGISIEGATKNNGAPPQPNSNLNLGITSKSIEAFQKSGFNIKFNTSETAIAGAYLQFKDLDDNNTTSYFDIPTSSFTQSKSINTKDKTSSKSSRFSKSKSLVDSEYEIDIDFDSSFPPGKFCGVLCIYDSASNISQPISICVEVEAWGGNANIVGKWNMIESSDDDTTTIDCTNSQTINVPYEETIKDDLIISFLEDGSFLLTEKGEYKYIDYDASANSCSAVYSNEIDKDDIKESGQWAFNEIENTLTVVSFKYEDFLEPQYNEVYPNGDLILESATANIVNGKLVISETYIDNNQTYTDEYIFERI
jgi:hypothetical protein